VLPIRASHITALAALPMIHRDPFDRLLIAQAVAEGLGFVTNDGMVGDYPVQIMW
jgi:PIN domain nuclease of toxin-antitoxin system